MKIQKQVCTFEQGLKLKELGVNYKEANFYWEKKIFDEPKGFGIYFHFQKPHVLGDEHKPNFVPAFTVAELGIMLGEGHPSWQFEHSVSKKQLFIVTRIGPNDPLARYKYKNSDLIPMNTYEAFDRYKSNEAEARAELLIASINCEVPGFRITEINERLLA